MILKTFTTSKSRETSKQQNKVNESIMNNDTHNTI